MLLQYFQNLLSCTFFTIFNLLFIQFPFILILSGPHMVPICSGISLLVMSLILSFSKYNLAWPAQLNTVWS